MSTLTINNDVKLQYNFNYIEIYRTEDCGRSTLVFTLEGDGSIIPINVDLSGFPDKQSGSAEGSIYANDVIFKDELGNPISQINIEQQPSYTEDNAFVHKQFFMQFTGVKQFKMTVRTTTFAVRPSTHNLAIMRCDCFDDVCESMGVNASLAMSTTDNNLNVSVWNNSTMYF